MCHAENTETGSIMVLVLSHILYLIFLFIEMLRFFTVAWLCFVEYSRYSLLVLRIGNIGAIVVLV